MTSGEHSNSTSGSRAGDGADWLSVSRAAMNTVASALVQAPFAGAVEAIDQYRSLLDATEALLIAQRSDAGFSDRATEGVIKKSGGVSKGEAKKRTSRAAAIKKNPDLATKLADGDISTEQVDLIADASAKTDGLAATDDELIDELAGANPDVGRGIARKFVDDHTSAADRNSRHEWQRKRRKMRKGRSTNGLAWLMFEGDDESINSMERSIKRGADALYRKDGGRDVPHDKHPRTNDHRLFDAAVENLASDTEYNDSAFSDEAQGNDAERTEGNTKSAERKATTVRQPRSRPSERPTMVFTGKLTDITTDPELLAEWEAELVGTGLVPAAVSSYYRCISEFAGQLVNGKGEVLWHGRAKRLATPAQWTALVIRDGGCVRCGADVHRCEAHHTVPFSAPAKGETNIDQLAMVCPDCHHWLHEANITMVWEPGTGTWQYRNATWAEQALKRPPPRTKPRPESPTPNAASRHSTPEAQPSLPGHDSDQPRLI